MFSRLVKSALVAALVFFGFLRPALADSWPTSFGMAKLTVQGQTYKPYRGVGVTPQNAQRDVAKILAHVGKKGTTLAETFSAVQVVDSIAFNMNSPKDANKVYRQFEKGLSQLATGGDGLNSQVAFRVHSLYKKMRTGSGRGLEKTKAWKQLKQIQKTVKAPALDLMMSALRNDISDGYRPWYNGQVSKTAGKKADRLNARSQRGAFTAAAKILFQNSAKTPSRASRHDRQMLDSYLDYSGYYQGKAPTATAIKNVMTGKGTNMAKIGKLQRAYNGLNKGRNFRLPGYKGRVTPRATRVQMQQRAR